MDLDNTLIDSVKRLRDEMTIARNHGIDETNFWKAVDIAFAKYGITNFSYQTLYDGCREIKPGLSKNILKDWNEILKTPHPFPDTYTFLNSFPKEELTILTTGQEDFQRAKITTHGLATYFSEIKIVPSPKGESITPFYPSVFVDDSPREIDAMKNRHPHVYCIKVREPALWEKQKHSLYADIACPDLLTAIPPH